MLRNEPSSSEPSVLDSVALPDDTPAHREQLSNFVSRGMCKEAVDTALTHGGLKNLSEKDVEKYCERWEAHVGAKTTEPLVDSFPLLAGRAIETFVKVENVKALHKDLKKDMANTEFSDLAGALTLRCGSWLALASGASRL